jgi:hypothetical protein
MFRLPSLHEGSVGQQEGCQQATGGVEGHVHIVLHDDVHRRTSDKRDEGRHAEGGSVSLIFISKVMKHGRYCYPRHAESERRGEERQDNEQRPYQHRPDTLDGASCPLMYWLFDRPNAQR